MTPKSCTVGMRNATLTNVGITLMIVMRTWPTVLISISHWLEVYKTSYVSLPCEQFKFQPVSEKDVVNVILNLPSNKAPGFDSLPAT